MFASRLTTKYQATIPKPIRRFLGLEKGDFIAFEILKGAVTLKKASRLDEGVKLFFTLISTINHLSMGLVSLIWCSPYSFTGSGGELILPKSKENISLQLKPQVA